MLDGVFSWANFTLSFSLESFLSASEELIFVMWSLLLVDFDVGSRSWLRTPVTKFLPDVCLDA